MKKHKDFKLPWLYPISKSKWECFLKHTFMEDSRVYVFEVVKSFLEGDVILPADFAEIGFGQTFDFSNFAKLLQDQKKIKYIGYEITKQFVVYAKEKYPDYDFIEGGFRDLKKDSFDITYARHVFEHLDPLMYEECLESLLAATRKLCIITWFIPPREHEVFKWEKDTGCNNSGAYVNVYSKDKIFAIIKNAGFVCHEKRVGIYEVTR